ncbi:hypothetical protein [Arthrobacter sp. SLBN-53]|uniref:hypothetical protein n=1 Tax=Arthrobacter sp. SLBN-53 TaxID=2768412 RepID=UPI00114F7777|nr:hypothetical protein [Arthrobacter sp. SLBN-53]TQK29399.1 hypothetical protein FBY28_2402 [Arthrobacter sp. SLBN-53]
MNTPIYDQLATDMPTQPACATCGDYALTESIRELLFKLTLDYGVAVATSMVSLDFTEVIQLETTIRTIIDTIGTSRRRTH